MNNLPSSDIKAIYAMMRAGLVGPYKEYVIAFSTTPQDPKKKKEFREIYPEIYDFMSLKDSRNQTRQDMAKQAAMALMSEGMPAWLKESIQGE